MQPSMRLRLPHLRLLPALAAGLLLAACGGGGVSGYGFGGGPGPGPLLTGTVVAENDTAGFPETVMHDFQLWPTGGAPSGANLLPYELYPGEWVDVANVVEDFYDADAFMSDGTFDYLEVWDAVLVSAGTDTVFFAF
jgi:hypothetical protein